MTGSFHLESLGEKYKVQPATKAVQVLRLFLF